MLLDLRRRPSTPSHLMLDGLLAVRHADAISGPEQMQETPLTVMRIPCTAPIDSTDPSIRILDREPSVFYTEVLTPP